jgi:endonuclease-3
LILTVLSQATSDLNSGRAFESLRARFSSWDEVLAAPVDEVADAIRSGGIADVKARRIQAILRAIEEREGDLDLGHLNRLPDEEVEDYLGSLPGVGPKTVACVLLFSMGRDAFPVDTHVFRVGRRLGLIAPKVTAEGAHRTLGKSVPPDIRYRFHIALIRHGRTICKPRMPLCSECAVFDLCEAGPKLLAAGEAR